MDADDGGVGEGVGEAVEDGVLSFSGEGRRQGGRGGCVCGLKLCLSDTLGLNDGRGKDEGLGSRDLRVERRGGQQQNKWSTSK